MTRTLLISFVVLSLSVLQGNAQEKLFSGPQVGEKLPPFKVRGFFEPYAGKEVDFVTQAAGKPIVLVFIHDVNRMSLSLARFLTAYTVTRAKEGLATGVIWLADDVTEAEITMKRSGHALTREAPTGISLDGKEGPGSYGLNRNVTLTILVGKDNKVTANFPLVQPSIQADLPKILEAVSKVAGGRVAKLEDVPGLKEMLAKQAPQPDAKVQGLMRQLIQKAATPEDVEKAAGAIEAHVKQNEAARKEIGRIARTIVEGGKVVDYGTPKAQEYLRKWAKEYGGGK
jgi:hypothetical protein